MTNRNYKIGRNFEYAVAKYLRQYGWEVRRAYASKGLFDLLAYRDGMKLGIQVKSLKSNNNRSYLDPTERKTLIEYESKRPTPYEFVSWSKKYQLPLLQLLDERFTVIHAFNLFEGIGFNLLSHGVWRGVFISQVVLDN